MFIITILRFVSLAALLLIISALPTHAFEPEYADDAHKIPLRWKSNQINIALSNSLRQPGANIKPGSDLAGAVRRSLKTWETAANVRFNIVWTDKVSISAADGAGDGVSLITIAATAENVLPFQGDASEIAGRTRFFYTSRGKITEADVVLNPYQQFSTDNTFGTYDFEAALTHEIGHLLGLSHSLLRAATMYHEMGKNGTFNLPAVSSRTLAEDDRAAIRALYGAAGEDQNCCGAIGGTLASTQGKPLLHWQVWAEAAATGKLFAATTTNQTGTFLLGGLPPDVYRIIAQPENNEFSAQTLSETTVESNKTQILNRRIALRKINFQVLFAGLNAQLSTLAAPLNADDREQTVFVAGENLSGRNLAIIKTLASSPFLTVNQPSLTEQNFDRSLSAWSYNLRVKPGIAPGEYSLRWQTASGETNYLLGCFTVESGQNQQ